MKITITNKEVLLEDCSPEVKARFTSILSYRDKQKEYQLKRLAKNPMQKYTGYYKQVQSEIKNCLLEERGNTLVFPSGLADIVKITESTVEDKRCMTGTTISLPWINKPYDLRNYQEEAVQIMENNWRGLINLSTGLGKSIVGVYVIKRIKKNALVVVPSDSIAKQFYADLVSAFGESKVGMFGGGKKKIRPITVGIAASVVKHVDEFRNYDLGLVIFDETHRIACDTFYAIAVGLGDVGKVFGLTATDYRSDGKDLLIRAGCGPTLIERDLVWGIKNGWLAEPYFLIRRVFTKGRSYQDDKLKNYKEHVLNNALMKARIESDFRNMIEAGKKTICLVAEIEHGEELSKNLGVPFAQGSDKQSQSYVEALERGDIMGLIGTTGKIGEGTNIKSVEVMQFANFLAYKGPVMQEIGRGSRKTETKKSCLYLDYIPEGSVQLKRHAEQRIAYYRDITNNVKVV
jgi:superfamily II DNA or RNA helicase